MTTATPIAKRESQREGLIYPGPYYEQRFFMEERYGKVLHKVPVDFNYGCPHRTPEHHGGCTFCPEDGSRATQIDGIDSLSEQIKAAVAFAQNRYKATGFTAYVQAYTATFAPVNKFREKMAEILSKFPFDCLHLGTRPDCLPKSTLEYLQSLSQSIDLWVELGLQTVHDKTLLRIQREHDWACSLKGIKKLKDHGLQTVSHVILGLPGETREDMMETARVMAQQPLDGIKIHNLHVLENTQLAVEYREQPFHLLGELEYLDIVAEFLRYLPPDLPVMRINTDTPPKELVAPHWNVQKGQMRERLIRHMEDLGMRQGDRFEGHSSPLPQLALPRIKTADTLDDSKTVMSRHCGEAYHPKRGARSAAWARFVAPSQLERWSDQEEIQLLDIGFGVGYNSLVAMERALSLGGPKLHVHALERDRMTAKAFDSQHNSFDDAILDANLCLRELTTNIEARSTWEHEQGHRIQIHWGEARYEAQRFSPETFDLIYLDPFDEKNNTELLSVEWFQWLHHLLRPHGRLMCSRVQPAVGQALLDAGFSTRFLCGEFKGLVAFKSVEGELDLDSELWEQTDYSAVQESRLRPYRDPHLCWSHKDIVRARNKGL
jgi:radical SAM protein (TIGR01212 family)